VAALPKRTQELEEVLFQISVAYSRDMQPFVRVIVVNFDGADITIRCLTRLLELDYPSDRYEIVLVDNGSIDGLCWKVRRRFPRIKVIDSLTNEGFARGNNLAMQNLDGVDVVALINNDAIPESAWLIELVSALGSSPRLGAATSKMYFNRKVTGVELRPLGSDIRVLGVSFESRELTDGFGFDERFVADGNHGPILRAEKAGSLHIELDDSQNPSFEIGIRLIATQPCAVEVRGPGIDTAVTVGVEPSWYLLPGAMVGRLINNAGGGIFPGFHGGDVGFRELDLEQYDTPREVFSFCGGAVALRSSFLRDVGLFDPSFFLYYEDLDLSWRAHYKGWSIQYVPTSVVYHEHAYSSGEGSPFFRFWVDRNRRLTLVKNAPTAVAVKAVIGAVVWGVRDAFLPPLRSLIRLRRPQLGSTLYRLRQMASFLKSVPPAVKARRTQLKTSPLKPSFVYDWVSQR
jgi:GT2 family glycosyltransferase